MDRSFCITTGAVEISNYHLAFSVKGHMAGNISRSLNQCIIEGNTKSFSGPWDILEKQISLYRPAITLIESTISTGYVYFFASRFTSGVYACKSTKLDNKSFELFDNKTLQSIGLFLAYLVDRKQVESLNHAALEIFAKEWCQVILEIPDLDWKAFWGNVETALGPAA
jgi:hypothetical protein